MSTEPTGQEEPVTFTAPQFCKAVGITYRQCDYWCRTGVLEPVVEAQGSGCYRQFDRKEAEVATVLTHLRAAGAELDLLRRVGSQLRMDVSFLKPRVLFIDCDGWCSREPSAVCWRLDLTKIIPLLDASGEEVHR
jgi:hypothetical protein